MNPFKVLQDDHRNIERLLRDLASTAGGSQRRQALFRQVKQDFELHADIEERWLYPLLEESDEAKDMIFDAYEVHDLVRNLLAEMERENSASDAWQARLAVVKENVEDHIADEEEKLFPEAEDLLSDETINQLARQISEAKPAAVPARKAQ